ncbi:MAG: DNA methyltransferase [Clostridia bacterium]|nr:DNA methyltransferase [Clostridia bacterium]MDD3094399.1 DNA methyltransferase [Clostridia bacterium]
MSTENKITVLGLTFNSEEERRTYFREELRKKLPELKQMEGFPIGEDEDILNLSDPPYYTACPNPWLNDFIAEWEEEKKDLEKQGLRKANFEVTEPYAADVSEGKNNPIYMAHSYHTKVPHPAIMRYILHYTQPGDIVFDGFAGTGMTGVAASISRSRNIRLEENNRPLWGKRNAIVSDLSPIASFIAYNYNSGREVDIIIDDYERIINYLNEKYIHFYKTRHSKDHFGSINYIIYSDVFLCPSCNNDVVYFNEAVTKNKDSILSEFKCPSCSTVVSKRTLHRKMITKVVNGELLKISETTPVLINYSFKNKRFEKVPDAEDFLLIESIEKNYKDVAFPTDILPDGFNTAQPKTSHNAFRVNHFFSKRALVILNELLVSNEALFLLTASMWNASKLYRWRTSGKGGIMNGVLYIASTHQENNVISVLKNKLNDIRRAFAEPISSNLVSTHSASHNPIQDSSVDYIFTDPPFGGNIMYSELSYLWESWLKVKTNNKPEAIENTFQNKGILEYQRLMSQCFQEFYRILKDGKWMTVEFSNTGAAVWNGIQTSLNNAGFVVANVASLDKKQGSFKAVTTVTAVKQDLVISCYKPSSEFDQKFNQLKHSDVGVWEFIAEHLEHLPIHLVSGNSTTAIIERSPKILFDRLIAFYVQRGLPVPIDAGKFQQGLRERFIERDGMFFTNEQVQEYDRKKAAVPNFVQLSIFVTNEQDAIYWLRHILEAAPKTEQDLHPLWMKEVAGNMRKGDTLPEMRTILEENFLKNDKGQWYLPDPENEADLEKLRAKRLLKQFETYKTEAYKPKGRIKEARVEALRAGFKECYQEKDFKTIVHIGDRIPNNLLMEDEVLLQFYDIASSRV